MVIVIMWVYLAYCFTKESYIDANYISPFLYFTPESPFQFLALAPALARKSSSEQFSKKFNRAGARARAEARAMN